MNTLAAENHYNWQVEIGSHRRKPSGQEAFWEAAGNGCLIHPQIILTSRRVWKDAEKENYRMSESMVRIGKVDYPCKLGHEDKERRLAALILASPARNRDGQAFSSYPSLAEQPPQTGQALGLLKTEWLHSEHSLTACEQYLCFTFGCVSLLRGKDELLFGLSGLVWQGGSLGRAIFDERGRIYGVSTDYLRTESDKRNGDASSGYLIFAPVYLMAAAAKQLALDNSSQSA